MKFDLNVVMLSAADYMLLAAAVLSILAAVLLIMILAITFVDNAAKKSEDAKEAAETKSRVEARHQALMAATEAAETAKLNPPEKEKPEEEEAAEQSDAVEVETTAVEEFEETLADESENTEPEEEEKPRAEQGPIEMSVNDFEEALADESEAEKTEASVQENAKTEKPEDKADLGVAATMDDYEERIIYRYSVRGKIILAEEAVQNYVGRIEDELRSYSAVTVIDAWSKIKFFAGEPEKIIAYLMFRRKTPRLALNLDPAACELGLAVDMSEKKRFQKTPVVIDVRSEEALEDAFRLIALALNGIEGEKTEVEPRDYTMEPEDAETLVEKGLARSRVGKVRRRAVLFGNRHK